MTNDRAIRAQLQGKSHERHVSAIWAWLHSGTPETFAEMQDAEAYCKQIETQLVEKN